MDTALRNKLWSLLKLHCWDKVSYTSGGIGGGYYLSSHSNKDINSLCTRLWFHYFKYPLDQLSNNWSDVLTDLREYYFSCKWFEVYDFVEFVANNHEAYGFKEKFIRACNFSLESEMSAYRFVDGLVVPIADSTELEAVESALDDTDGPVYAHLRRAIELLSDRKEPDYRNSIKESISAIESLVSVVIGTKGTLGQLIKRIEENVPLHGALKSAFSNLYGYTSDEGGIRHALLDSPNVDYHDAKLMLVLCSTFVNYVQGKQSIDG